MVPLPSPESVSNWASIALETAMTIVKDLPDYPAIQQLARALWRNGSARGAAVMVGAGFTRNVSRPGEDTRQPPLWDSLRQDLVTELYRDHPERAPVNPLRIAEEYRTTFGQAALDDFIRIRFPDRAWLPGALHIDLLDLPWADVLTTNWDTVLERAIDQVPRRVYDIVRFETDLTHAQNARIRKASRHPG